MQPQNKGPGMLWGQSYVLPMTLGVEALGPPFGRHAALRLFHLVVSTFEVIFSLAYNWVFLKLKLTCQICLICLIFLPNLPNLGYGRIDIAIVQSIYLKILT